MRKTCASVLFIVAATILVTNPSTVLGQKGGPPAKKADVDKVLAALDALSKKVDANHDETKLQIQALAKGQDELTKEFGKFRSEVNTKFTAVDKKLGDVDSHLVKIDGRLEGIDAKIDKLNARLDTVEKTLRETLACPKKCAADCRPCTYYGDCCSSRYIRVRCSDCCYPVYDGGYYRCCGHTVRVTYSPCRSYWHCYYCY